MDERQIIDQLTKIDFDEREARLYLETLKRPEIKASELYKITGLSRPFIYEILSQMVAKGYLTEKTNGRNRIFRAVKPDQVFNRLQNNWQESLVIASNYLVDLEKEYEKENNNEFITSYTKVLNSTDKINEQYVVQIDSLKEELLAFVRAPFLAQSPTIRNLYDEAMDRARLRGVKFRSILMYDPENWKWLKKAYDEMPEYHDEIRISSFFAAKAMIFDKTKILVSIQPAGTEDVVMICYDDPVNASVYHHYFNLCWKDGFTIQQWQERIDEGLIK